MDNEELDYEDLTDKELDYWVQQGLVTVDENDMFHITESGMKDPVVRAVWDTMISEELTHLVEQGYVICWWDDDEGDMMYELTEKGRAYAEGE